MSLKPLLAKSSRILRTNSPAILTAIGVTGTVTTAYLAHEAGINRVAIIEDDKNRRRDEDGHVLWMGWRHTFDLTWRIYIPPVTSGVLTVAAIVLANKAGARKTAAVTTAYAISEKAFAEYKEKVVETIGKNKEQKIRDSIAQDQVANNPPSEKQLIVSGPGNVICCELHTGRYFTSNMEKLRRAVNDLNSHMVRSGYAYLSDFYHLIGLENTTQSDHMGWESDKMLDLSYSTALTKLGEPCITFEYSYIKSL